MKKPFAAFLLAMLFAAFAAAQVPTPESFYGFRMGTDKKLARWDKIVEYFQTVAAHSDRVRVRTLGPTTNNNPFIVAEIASPETIKNLDHFKQLERKLYFQGGAPTPAERDEILKSGKAVVVITNAIHATEIGATQMVSEALYRLATEDTPEIHKILDNVIFVLVPCLNPDGEIIVTDWYNKQLGTPYEASPIPWVYHPYVGHDNNRDMYLFSQRESRMTAELLWHDWFPSIWLDEHQMGSNGARIFTMPATDPINPNVHPLIYRLNGIYGQQQSAALEAEGKTGIIYNSTYTNFWEGAMAWAGWWHNEVGLLTEVASARIATPLEQRHADPSRPTVPPAAAGDFEGERRRSMEHPEEPIPAPTDVRSRTEYPRPWLGGTWKLRDIVDYELTATFALLSAAADRRETLLHEIYEVNRATIADGTAGTLAVGPKAFAAIIPADQHDANEAGELVDKLLIAGIEVHRATKEFKQDGETYAAGTYVIPFNQVFARYAKDMLEKQTYPEVRRAPNAPAEAPYDVSAWSLGMQFGVKTVFAKTALPKDLALERITASPKQRMLTVDNSFMYAGADDARLLNRFLKAGAKVSWTKSGFQVTGTPQEISAASTGFERVQVKTGSVPAGNRPPMKAPRLAMYQSWTANMDEGWTRWVLEHYEFPYTTLHNDDVKAGHLRDHFDAIILPDQQPRDIETGLDFSSIVPEYRGGLGVVGWKALDDFVKAGGTLIAMGNACNYLIEKMPLPVKDIKRTTNREQHFAPGTIVNLQIDTSHPLGRGMPAETWAYYINTPFFTLTEGFASQRTTVAARFPNTSVNASGWLRGEDYMYGRAAVVAVEMNPGKVILFGIRPQHRAQTHATLPMLFNAIYWSAE